MSNFEEYDYRNYITPRREGEEDYIDESENEYEDAKAKKKKRQESRIPIGEVVTYRNKPVTVIFGPYEKNYKQFYEIRTQEGKIFPATSTALHREKGRE